jgi:hypothetical protein
MERFFDTERGPPFGMAKSLKLIGEWRRVELAAAGNREAV